MKGAVAVASASPKVKAAKKVKKHAPKPKVWTERIFFFFFFFFFLPLFSHVCFSNKDAIVDTPPRVYHSMFASDADGKGKEEENDSKQRNSSLLGPVPGAQIDSLQSFLQELAQSEMVAAPASGRVVFDLPSRQQSSSSVVEVGQESLGRLEQELGRLVRLAKPETRQEQEALRASLAEQVEEFLNGAVDVLRSKFASKKQLSAAEGVQLDLQQALAKQEASNAKLSEQASLVVAKNAELRAQLAREEELGRRLTNDLAEAQRQSQALEADLANASRSNADKQQRLVVASTAVAAAASASQANKREQSEKRSAEMLEAIKALEDERDVLKKQVENLKQQARNSKMTAVSHATLDESKHKEAVEQLRAQLEHSNRQLEQISLAEIEAVRLRKERAQLIQALEKARSERTAFLEERQATNVKVQRLMAALKKLTGM